MYQIQYYLLVESYSDYLLDFVIKIDELRYEDFKTNLKEALFELRIGLINNL